MGKFTIPALLLLFLLIGCNTRNDRGFPILRGDYLGQPLPGDKPVMFAPGIVSTGMYERDCAVSPDGNEIYYSLFQGDWNTIMVTRRVNGVWHEPVVAEFARDTARYFAEPAFAPDGNSIFYLSARQGWQEQDIWMAKRQADGSWGEGTRLPENINLLGEFYPSIAQDGTMYFCRTDEKSGISQILRSKLVNGVYSDPEVLPAPINAKGTHFNACIAPDGSYLVGCVAGRDSLNPRGATYMLFFHNSNDTWSEGVDLIKELKLPCRNAISISVSPDGNYLFFASSDKSIRFGDVAPDWRLSKLQARRTMPGNGNSDIYWMRFDGVVEKLKSRCKM